MAIAQKLAGKTVDEVFAQTKLSAPEESLSLVKRSQWRTPARRPNAHRSSSLRSLPANSVSRLSRRLARVTQAKRLRSKQRLVLALAAILLAFAAGTFFSFVSRNAVYSHGQHLGSTLHFHRLHISTRR